MPEEEAGNPQKPLELILARNLLTSLSTPGFLLGAGGELLFYNEGAGALLGVTFEDAGRMMPEEWISTFGPYDADDEPIPLDELSLTQAIRDRRPGHSNFRVRVRSGEFQQVAASALPIISTEHGATGAMIIFWPLDERAARAITAEHALAEEPT